MSATKLWRNSTYIPALIKVLEEGHTITIPLHGNSMRPFLQNGRDKAELVLANGRFEVGDVVLAEVTAGYFVLHRIIAIDNDDITLLGDGNLKNEYCQKSDVKAKAVKFFRKGSDKPEYLTGKKWKMYSSLWMKLYPIRRYLLFIFKFIGY